MLKKAHPRQGRPGQGSEGRPRQAAKAGQEQGKEASKPRQAAKAGQGQGREARAGQSQRKEPGQAKARGQGKARTRQGKERIGPTLSFCTGVMVRAHLGG